MRFIRLLRRRIGVDVTTIDPAPISPGVRDQLEGLGCRVIPGGINSIFRLLEQCVYAAVVCEFWTVAARVLVPVRSAQPWARVIVDSVDVHFLREEAGVAFGAYNAADVAVRREQEVSSYRASDGVVVVTREDQEALEGVGGIRRTYIIPIIVTLRPRPSLPRQPELLFIGGFGHRPNVDGIVWFCREVFPLVQRECPAVRLNVIGGGAPDEVRALGGLGGVSLLGQVPDTSPYLDRAAVSVAPLRYGGGMKGKVTEALAAGIPVVTTSFGTQGLGAVSGEHLFQADTPEDFAKAILRLLGDPELADSMGRAGRERVDRVCGEQTVLEQVAEMVGGFEPPPGGVASMLPRRLFQLRRLWKRVAGGVLRRLPG